jgi:hypothetical protein
MWHASDTTHLQHVDSFYSRPIINYWFFNDYRRERHWLNTRVCAISHSIADCLYLFVFEIDYSLPLIIKGKERERAHAHIYAFQSNLNILTYMEREKQNSCRHFIYVCLCVAILVWTFFKCINARQRNQRRKRKISTTN